VIGTEEEERSCRGGEGLVSGYHMLLERDREGGEGLGGAEGTGRRKPMNMILKLNKYWLVGKG
jgi:hypothetical protein